jgi:heat shock protein HslJ
MVNASNGTFVIGNVGATKMACNDLKTEQFFQSFRTSK